MPALVGKMGLTYGNGVTLALARDLDGRVTAIDAMDGASPVLDLDYALYDLAGNIRTITDTGGTGRDRRGDDAICPMSGRFRYNAATGRSRSAGE